MRSPTSSEIIDAIRNAAALAANLRGSSTNIFETPACISASGTSVVFPAPGGATSTAFRPSPTITRNNSGNTAATGNPKASKSCMAQPVPPKPIPAYTSPMRTLALLISLLIPGLAAAATSNLATTPRDTVSLTSPIGGPSNGTIHLALNFNLAPGWHIYWQNPGDAGLPPAITLATGTAGPFTYPAPQLLIQGPVAAYVLSGDTGLAFTATNVIGKTIEADATWLVCSDICIPEHAHFTLPATPEQKFPYPPLVTPLPRDAVIPSPYPTTIAPDGTLTLTGLTGANIASAHFFPFSNGQIINRAPQTFTLTPNGITLKLPTTPSFTPKTPLSGLLELTDENGFIEHALTITPKPTPTVMPANAGIHASLDTTPAPFVIPANAGIAPTPSTPFIATLAFAFLGGLILNLMPCVFPILAMKSLAILRLGGHAAPKIRAESLAYTAGILTAMLILAGTLLTLRAAGIQAGWGFQFQSPFFVAIIAWLIFAAGLSLAGAFHVTGMQNIAARLAGHNSFFTGLLAVAVATPCTAPFMGAALAAALTAPPLTALSIFLTLGLGLSLPFLLLAFIPNFARILPRPGSWMLLLQRALSIPMFATFIWLAWVLKFQTGLAGVALLSLGAAALGLAATEPRRRPLALAALLILPFFRPSITTPTLTLPNAEPYSPSRLAALQSANTPVFIDMTAAWCVTCLVNDRTTLQSPAVQATLSAHHVKILVGDWTDRNPAITAFLAENHRAGVPLYLYLPPNAPPKTLPQILTPDIIEEAVN
jgi:thiol:disulfide interchange protein DsbD